MNYLTAVVLAVCIVYAYSCSCPYPEPNEDEKYCANGTQFVVLVYTKTSATNAGGSKKYRIRTSSTETYKSTVTETIKKQYVYTASDSAQCGITNLIANKYYILSGYYTNCGNKKCMNIAQCNSIVNVYDTSPNYTSPSCT